MKVLALLFIIAYFITLFVVVVYMLRHARMIRNIRQSQEDNRHEGKNS